MDKKGGEGGRYVRGLDGGIADTPPWRTTQHTMMLRRGSYVVLSTALGRTQTDHDAKKGVLTNRAEL